CLFESYFFFFQAEDGIRDFHVTGVQTCALPISGIREYLVVPRHRFGLFGKRSRSAQAMFDRCRECGRKATAMNGIGTVQCCLQRSEERRVGKECRSGGSTNLKKQRETRGEWEGQ